MGSEFSLAEIQRMKDSAQKEIKEAFDELQRDFPEAVDVVAAAGAAAGVVLLTGPLGVVGYAIAKNLRNKQRNAKQVAALRRAIEKLYKIQDRLLANAEHFREELAEIKASIDELKRQKP